MKALIALKKLFENTDLEEKEAEIYSQLFSKAAKFTLAKTTSEISEEDFLKQEFPDLEKYLRSRYSFFLLLFKEIVKKIPEEIMENEYLMKITDLEDENTQIDFLLEWAQNANN